MSETAVRCHPEYAVKLSVWDKMRDTFAGETAVKAAGVKYLAKTSGQSSSPDGAAMYDAYKSRAIYYNFPSETKKSMLGLMWRKPAAIVVPSKMEGLQTQATPDGLDLDDVLMKINSSQISDGRVGILVDVKDNAPVSELPYLSIYGAESVVNWYSEFVEGEEILKCVVLDESGMSMNDSMEWDEVESWRVLLILNGKYATYTVDSEDQITLMPDEKDVIYPSFGGKTLDYIPFVFCNVSDTLSGIEMPPLSDLCDLSLSLYRQEADYRQALFMQGQGTPYATGVTKDEASGILFGAFGMVSSENKDAKFGFMELSGQGLPEMRQAVEALKKDCIRLGVSFIEQGQTESGAALETRLSTKTASLKTIATTGGKALGKVLKIISEWTGSPEADVSVTPNLDFADDNSTTQDFVSLMSAKTLGAPLSYLSIHNWAREHGYTDMEYEEELEIIKEEGLPTSVFVEEEPAPEPDPNDPNSPNYDPDYVK